MLLDPQKAENQKRLLEIELEEVGVRINQNKPDIVFKQKTGGVCHVPVATRPLKNNMLSTGHHHQRYSPADETGRAK